MINDSSSTPINQILDDIFEQLNAFTGLKPFNQKMKRELKNLEANSQFLNQFKPKTQGSAMTRKEKADFDSKLSKLMTFAFYLKILKTNLTRERKSLRLKRKK